MLLHPTRLISLVALVAFASPEAVAQVLYSTDFTDLGEWTVDANSCGTPSVRWAADATPAFHQGGPFLSAPASLNFNNGQNLGVGIESCGSVTSPPIDLSAASSLDCSLRYHHTFDYFDEDGYDVYRARVLSEQGTVLAERLFQMRVWTWSEVVIPLASTWGTVRIEFWCETGDVFSNQGTGPFIDDLIVAGADDSFTMNCVGDSSTITGERVRLTPLGSTATSDNEFGLLGSAFPPGSVARAFFGTTPDIIPYAGGTRCIAVHDSYRLGAAPTGTDGSPLWRLDLMQPAPQSAPILAGSTWYFQALFQDGDTLRFSDSIGVSFDRQP